MKNRNQNHSNHWKTPIYISRWIKENYGICFDPCPYMSSFNGLMIPWKNLNYVNPGFDLKTKTEFIKKAVLELKLNGNKSLILIPFTAETNLFHDCIYPYANIIYIPKFRPQFAGFNTKGKYVTNNSGQSTIVLIELSEGYKLDEMPVIKKWDLTRKNGK